jgi:hypothetical protein
MRTKSFDHGRLKHPFSQEIPKLAPLPKKEKRKEK